MSDDPHPAYMKLCVEYEELREQQRTYPSQWQEIEKEKAVIRKQLQDFQQTHFGELSERVLRTNYTPERKINPLVAFVVFGLIIATLTALVADYFGVLLK